MTILVFLVDTSPSMAQTHYLGTSYLDFARQTVEQFLKQRQRDTSACKGDRYMLMTFEDYPANVKSGWKEGQTVFNEQLRSLSVAGTSDFNSAMSSALHFINLNRAQYGTDNWGLGRFPSYLEQVFIISISDGGTANFSATPGRLQVHPEALGAKWDVEPYRWDQRLYSIVLRLPGAGQRVPAACCSGCSGGVLPTLPLPADPSPIDAICSAMGGQSFAVTSHRMLPAIIDLLLQRMVQGGALVRLEFSGAEPPPPQTAKDEADGESQPTPPQLTNGSASTSWDKSWQKQMVTIFRPKSVGHWPIPEAYWPLPETSTIPPRQPHPLILFQYDAAAPEVPRAIAKEFPFDKYELSASPLTDYLLARKEPNVCWKVYVAGSSCTGGSNGFPFGYIKASSTHQCLSLFVLPYNWPKLLPLLDEARQTPSVTTSSSFRQRFDDYLATVPSYYYGRLAKAMRTASISLPKSMEERLVQPPYSLDTISSWTKTKQAAKKEIEETCSAIVRNLELSSAQSGPMTVRAFHGNTLNCGKVTKLTPLLRKYQAEIPQPFADLKVFISDPSMLSTTALLPPSTQFKNPFDIRRENLLEQLERMRVNFDLQVEVDAVHRLAGGMPGQRIKLQHAEDLHNQPIGKMGDYQEYARSLLHIGAGPRRELEPKATRQHAFGNPFKLDRKSSHESGAVDEVGDEMASEAETTRPLKRELERNRRDAQDATGNAVPQQSGSALAARSAKRKPGPLNERALMSWKRRRSSSVSDISGSDIDDMSSLCSAEEAGRFDELRDAEDADGAGDEAENNDDDNGEEEEEVQVLSPRDEPQASPNPPTSPTYHHPSSTSSMSNGFSHDAVARPMAMQPSPCGYEPMLQGLLDDSSHLQLFTGMPSAAPSTTPSLLTANHPNSRQQQQQSRRGQSPAVVAAVVNARPTLEGASLIKRRNQKQSELSRIVRSAGDKLSVFDKCIDCVSEMPLPERRILVGFAIAEARRFKRAELSARLEVELHGMDR